MNEQRPTDNAASLEANIHQQLNNYGIAKKNSKGRAYDLSERIELIHTYRMDRKKLLAQRDEARAEVERLFKFNAQLMADLNNATAQLIALKLGAALKGEASHGA